MRRPLKPFVTEYRGGARRQGPGAKPDPRLESEPRPVQSLSSSPAQEDSYEAALRAADALFSGRPRQQGAAPADPSSAGPDASAEAESSAPQSSPGGRILRAIDEPPPPELLRLEAEFAPKRRGRKPGSKNKPKVVAPTMTEADVAPSPSLANESPSLPAIEAVTALSVPSLPAAFGPAGVRGERYAWVRTKLKPGQQWKRRIPKVAW